MSAKTIHDLALDMAAQGAHYARCRTLVAPGVAGLLTAWSRLVSGYARERPALAPVAASLAETGRLLMDMGALGDAEAVELGAWLVRLATRLQDAARDVAS